MESSIAEFLARQSASEQLPRPFRFCFHSCQHSGLLGPSAPTYHPPLLPFVVPPADPPPSPSLAQTLAAKAGARQWQTRGAAPVFGAPVPERGLSAIPFCGGWQIIAWWVTLHYASSRSPRSFW